MSSQAEDSNGAILSDVPLSRYNPSFCLPLSLPSVLHALSPSPSLSSHISPPARPQAPSPWVVQRYTPWVLRGRAFVLDRVCLLSETNPCLLLTTQVYWRWRVDALTACGSSSSRVLPGMCENVHACNRTRTSAHTHTRIRARRHTPAHARAHTHTHKHARAHARTHARTHAHTHTHASTHLRACTLSPC